MLRTPLESSLNFPPMFSYFDYRGKKGLSTLIVGLYYYFCLVYNINCSKLVLKDEGKWVPSSSYRRHLHRCQVHWRLVCPHRSFTGFCRISRIFPNLSQFCHSDGNSDPTILGRPAKLSRPRLIGIPITIGTNCFSHFLIDLRYWRNLPIFS